MDDVAIFVEQLDCMLLCVCTVKDYRGRQNVVLAVVTHIVIFFLLLRILSVMFNSSFKFTATWNLLYLSCVHFELSVVDPELPSNCSLKFLSVYS